MKTRRLYPSLLLVILLRAQEGSHMSEDVRQNRDKSNKPLHADNSRVGFRVGILCMSQLR